MSSNFLTRMLATAIIGVYCSVACAQYSSDSLVRWQLEEYGVRFSSDNSVVLLMSGQEKFYDMFTAIRQAQKYVHLEYFNFRNDSIASLLFEILKEKRKQGIEVRALFDGFGNDSNNRPLKKKHITSLREDSIDIHEFDPIRFPWVNHIWPRDHRKIVIIDGNIAYTGGMNVADYYLEGTEQVGEWRDMHCRIQGAAVNDLQSIFLRIWKKTTGEDLVDVQRYYQSDNGINYKGLKKDTAKSAGHKVVGIVNREPYTTNEAVRLMYVSAINNAKDSIHIVNPYFTLIPSVKKALKRAIERGVKVEIMISSKSDIPLTPDVVFYNAHKMMLNGAKVWMYQSGFHHSKIMMVDGRFCTVGSTNLDARSLRFDYEENALILDIETTKELDLMFENDRHKSILLTPDEWEKARTRWQKARGWIGHFISPFL